MNKYQILKICMNRKYLIKCKKLKNKMKKYENINWINYH